MTPIKKFIKRFIPESLLSYYHLTLARLGSFYYGNPSNKMIVVGVTGTKGKSSAGSFIWSCLQTAGYKTGLLSTAVIRIGELEFPNRYHMTMPGRFILQKLLSDMYDAGCKIAIVETTSEGIKQSRHIGISYDYAIFTNLYPEHLTSHGNSFEEYKKTKGKLFTALKQKIEKLKTLSGKTVYKTSIVNIDSPHAVYFLSFDADKKITYGLSPTADLQATNIVTTEVGSRFTVKGDQYEISIPGDFNIENSLPAIVLCQSLNIDPTTIARGLLNLKNIPGRMESIDIGQNFKIYVDYAHQKESMEALLKTAKTIVAKKGGKIIVLLGAEGGGRDKGKRASMGKLAGDMADYVIVTNVDPYDDDPREIIEDIAKAVIQEGKVREKNLFTPEDRRLGIRQALALAKENDVVLITGKGSEQSMILKGEMIPWDDRVVVKEEIKNLICSQD